MKKEIANKVCSVYPCPNLIVSCCDGTGRNNALVVGFAGNVSIEPPLVMIGIIPGRFSHHMVKETREFVINFPTKDFEKEYWYLGSQSGKDGDKFDALKLNWKPGDKVKAPMLTDCPVNVECKVISSIQPGTHELFIASVEAVHCDEQYVGENGMIDWSQIPLL